MSNKVKFDKYANLLRQWSQRMNLVAPSTLGDIETRHIADSAQLADILPKDVEIADLGSGAGFPGIVLAILGWKVT
ncbi:MAG: class I SAM-dependent methyltransferase, partial [Alphaproteobacteria bacterium]|nr:class I SAM-dependent methyltransferase [Alphaproteobacteria bacterium]